MSRSAKIRIAFPPRLALARFYLSLLECQKAVSQPSLDLSSLLAFRETDATSAAGPSGGLAALLGNLHESPVNPLAQLAVQDELLSAKLGLAAALFTALRAKHFPTAQHCFRVALRCSSFARQLGLEPASCERLEVAALLHDIGKIGVPDYVLTKPGALTDAEADLMNRHRSSGLEILGKCVGDGNVLEIVRCSFLRFDGKGQEPPAILGDDLPLEARILAVADAYDAMTTEHVYRAAIPRERALAELFEHAGLQFDPEIVDAFARLSAATEPELSQAVSRYWVGSGDHSSVNATWKLSQPLLQGKAAPAAAWLFQQRLLDAMHDGVIFIDSRRRIVLWNRGAERLSGLARESVVEKAWNCQMLDLRDAEGNLIRESHCPVDHVIVTGVQVLRRLTLTSARGDRVSVDVHVFPVTDERRRCYGAALLLHDVTSEMSLEQRVQNLHQKATTDPLTGVSNRAEFDRVHAAMVAESQESGSPFSIIICDIDHFKQVNDVHGHQAGDEALISFASLLCQHSREGDLVARYGGEEFVMLCPDCDNTSAARRAEEIRFALSQIAQPMLNQKCITASFGVTEIQLGDTPETMLRRADRALYQAKDSGRNRVVELGSGLMQEQETPRSSWLSFLKRKPLDCLLERRLVANVPMDLLVEKIRGFIADHDASIINIEENYVVLSVDDCPELQRRASDRPLALIVEMKLREFTRSEASKAGQGTRTLIEVSVRPKRSRDRRRTATDQANQLIASLKSYLIAQESADF